MPILIASLGNRLKNEWHLFPSNEHANIQGNFYMKKQSVKKPANLKGDLLSDFRQVIEVDALIYSFNN